MDEFKKYIQQHRSEMDLDEPPVMSIKPAARKRPSRVFRIGIAASAAACLALILFAGSRWFGGEDTLTALQDNTAIIGNQLKGQYMLNEETVYLPEEDSAVQPPVKKEEVTTGSLLNDLQQTYGVMVNMQLVSIRSTPVLAEDPDYFTAFRLMLAQTEQEETKIRKRIHASGISTTLLEKLIEIYQQKLDILKSLRTEIDKMNKKVNGNVPDTASAKKYYINI